MFNFSLSLHARCETMKRTLELQRKLFDNEKVAQKHERTNATNEKQKMRRKNSKKQQWKQTDEMDVTKMMHIFATWLKIEQSRKIAWNGVVDE